MKKDESNFRSKFVKLCNEHELYTLALETTVPGFPDIQILCNNKILLIETKSIIESELTHKVMTKFKSTQPVFYKEYLYKHNSNNDNLFCLIKLGKSNYIVFKITEEFVNLMNCIHFSEIIKYTKNYFQTNDLNKVIEWFKVFLK